MSSQTAGAAPADLESVVEELHKANEAFAQREGKMEAELKRLRAQVAKKAKGGVEVMDKQIGQDGVVEFVDDALIKPATSTLDDPALLANVGNEAFLNEPVQIRILDVAEENADIGFAVWVNGEAQVFQRNMEYTVRRKFVEALARAKRTSYGNKLRVDPMSGEQSYVWPSKTGLRYPFAVIEDRNPKGKAWLEAVLRQP